MSRRFRPSPAMVVACLALALSLGGTSYAAVQLARNSVTSAHVKDFSLLRRDFKRGQLPSGGGRGVSVRWAHIRGDGRILSQSGGISVARVDVGHYIINFRVQVTGKAILASASRFGDLGARGTVVAGPCGGEPEGGICPTGNDRNHVRVTTHDPGHTAREDLPFYVAVIG